MMMMLITQAVSGTESQNVFFFFVLLFFGEVSTSCLDADWLARCQQSCSLLVGEVQITW